MLVLFYHLVRWVKLICHICYVLYHLVMFSVAQ